MSIVKLVYGLSYNYGGLSFSLGEEKEVSEEIAAKLLEIGLETVENNQIVFVSQFKKVTKPDEVKQTEDTESDVTTGDVTPSDEDLVPEATKRGRPPKSPE